MEPSDYKHVALGLIFLKYISDAFEAKRDHLLPDAADPGSLYYLKEESARYAIAENRDEYMAENVFWVPKQARWSFLQDHPKQPDIGKLIDDTMLALEAANPPLAGVLPKPIFNTPIYNPF